MGPINEGDLSNAKQTGAIILGFDVSCSPNVNKTCQDSGVVIRLHKLIYKYTEDIENYVHDVKLKI